MLSIHRHSPVSTLRTSLIALGLIAGALGMPGPAFPGTLPDMERATVAPVVRAVTPGVVNIATRGVETVNDPMMQDPDFRQMFGIPEEAVRRETRSAGSGVIVDAARGFVLTNNHVIDKARQIEVTTK